jgi:hypothetical protein
MTLSFEETEKNISVIVSVDPAVHCTKEEHLEYLEDLDESRLDLNGDEPTRFIMRKMLDFKHIQKIKKSQLSMEVVDGQPGNLGIDMSTLTELRACLVDIENPGKGFEFKKDKADNLVAKDLVAKLESLNVSDELVLARRNAAGKIGSTSKKN